MTSYSVISQMGQGSSSRVLLATRKEETFVHLGPGLRFKVNGNLKSNLDLKLENNNITKKNKEDEPNKYVVIKERKYSKEAIQEARLLKALCVHPFIIKFEDAFIIRKINRLCIVMEQAEQDLKQVLARYAKANQSIPLTLASRWITQIAVAMDHLHCQGVVHRDIKPANLLLLKDGRLVLGDLGTAKQMNKFEHEFGCRTLLGTPLYLAPEVLHGCAYGTKADIWSLGCVAFEILMSGRAKAFDVRNIFELKRQVRRGFQQQQQQRNQTFKRAMSYKNVVGYDGKNDEINDDLEAEISYREDENHHHHQNNFSNERQMLMNEVVIPCLEIDPQKRIGLEKLIHLPILVRAIGAFVAEWKQGEISLNKNRGDCLSKQLNELGLNETCKAGIRLAGFQKHVSRKHHSYHGYHY